MYLGILRGGKFCVGMKGGSKFGSVSSCNCDLQGYVEVVYYVCR